MLSLLPILLISAIILMPKEFILFSGSILGKWLAIMIIVFVSIDDWVYGLLVCSCIIYYYNLDVVQAVLGKRIWENAYEPFSTIPKSPETTVDPPAAPETPKYSPYSLFDAIADFAYQSTSTPKVDAETLLEQVEINDVLQKYLKREPYTNDNPDERSERDRMLELEAKMRVPEETDWKGMMQQTVADVVSGWNGMVSHFYTPTSA